jgi:hypothetical protein
VDRKLWIECCLLLLEDWFLAGAVNWGFINDSLAEEGAETSYLLRVQ